MRNNRVVSTDTLTKLWQICSRKHKIRLPVFTNSSCLLNEFMKAKKLIEIISEIYYYERLEYFLTNHTITNRYFFNWWMYVYLQLTITMLPLVPYFLTDISIFDATLLFVVL